MNAWRLSTSSGAVLLFGLAACLAFSAAMNLTRPDQCQPTCISKWPHRAAKERRCPTGKYPLMHVVPAQLHEPIVGRPAEERRCEHDRELLARDDLARRAVVLVDLQVEQDGRDEALDRLGREAGEGKRLGVGQVRVDGGVEGPADEALVGRGHVGRVCRELGEEQRWLRRVTEARKRELSGLGEG